ncbi:allophanate hydrolase subunit 1 [Quadrisphaera sp. DSM 44207]|uniref:5-oxoprolinase subunit B family protein n=1 Tax=Quadrisphaera sp. DSM 44207 TaxID=1881057 RepID=UPI00089069D9|nr:allophanate hydrolase subunit 1 [Quadrisphaera sp. DSM 44207]SDQ86177.1 sensor histidine kinase inhibitor, KipI family [Quadrisphaera sp. DSM 44207]
MRVLPVGDAALLVELDDLAAVLAVHRALSAAPPTGAVDLVPAARTVLVRAGAPGALDAAAVAAAAGAALAAADGADAGADGGARDVGADGGEVVEVVEVPVVYDGEDLAEVARRTGLSTAGVVAAHTGSTWTVAFSGFAPGFGYLVGGDERLRVPRRAEPRTRVPAGAVALAGEFTGVYPRPSPGGWQLIGRTSLPVWDAERDPPALLRPGVRVRFTAVGA